MKKNLLSIFTLICFISLINKSYSQTDGTLSFTFTQTAVSGFTKNLIAVWIENGSGAFVKTKIRYWGNGTSDHLPTWKTNSSSNIVDAATGATRTASTAPTAYGVKTITWDGKNVNGTTNGTTVADGTYKIMIESSWDSNLNSNTDNTLVSYTFTKGTTAVHLTPTGDTHFSGITIDWTPTTPSSVDNISGNSEINIYPNPTNGILNINYSIASTIKIANALGSIIYEEKVEPTGEGNKIIDMSKFANGIYFVNVQNQAKSSIFKVILDK